MSRYPAQYPHHRDKARRIAMNIGRHLADASPNVYALLEETERLRFALGIWSAEELTDAEQKSP